MCRAKPLERPGVTTAAGCRMPRIAPEIAPGAVCRAAASAPSPKPDLKPLASFPGLERPLPFSADPQALGPILERLCRAKYFASQSIQARKSPWSFPQGLVGAALNQPSVTAAEDVPPVSSGSTA